MVTKIYQPTVITLTSIQALDTVYENKEDAQGFLDAWLINSEKHNVHVVHSYLRELTLINSKGFDYNA